MSVGADDLDKEKRGVSHALAAAGAGRADAAGFAPEADQGELLAMPLDEAAKASLAPEKRGRGRPKGSKSTKAKAWLAYLQAQGVAHPLEVLGQTYSMPVAELAAELGCDRVDAFKLQQAAASAALPYWQGKPAAELPEALQAGLALVFGSAMLADDEDVSDAKPMVDLASRLGEPEGDGS